MECREVQKYFHEYIDGALDKQWAAQIEEHLRTCEICSEELASLKFYLDEMRDLKKVKAPRDFLQKVHGRLEQPSGIKKIFHSIFFPLNVKLPLELAAVTTAIIAAIFVFNVTQPARRSMKEQLLLKSESAVIQDEAGKEPAESAMKRGEAVTAPGRPKQQAPTPVQNEKAGAGAVKKAPIEKSTVSTADREDKRTAAPEVAETAEEEPAPIISEDKLAESEKAAEMYDLYAQKEGDTGSSIEEKPIEIAFLIEPATPEKATTQRAAVGEAPEKRAKKTKKDKYALDALAPAEHAEPPAPSKEEQLEEKNGPQAPPRDRILSEVQDLITFVHGKVIAVEYEKDSPLPVSITAEIPAQQYSYFIQELQQFGKLKAPLPSAPEQQTEPVRLHIQLIPSNAL